ncbi:glycosyltransferase family 4 protein [Flavobacterium sp. LB2P44]|uniref:glycosyltransferase family 4 protein n=1 Tax=Flavobacterium sp. LB2P44 TaxID=3401713 RepID=UPI003AB0FE88
MKKILFISNTASRTGAPYVLLLFLKWLKRENKNLQIDIIFLEGGDLLEDFKAFTSVSYNYSDVLIKKAFLPKLYSYLFRKIMKKGSRKEVFIKNIARKNYDIIYANTIVSVAFGTAVKKRSNNNPKLIAHIHELNTAIKGCLPNFQEYVPYVDQFISVSKLVMENLNINWKVNPNINHLFYAFSDKVAPNDGATEQKKEGYSKKVFEVGASGLVFWRKGDDLFIQVANYIKTRYPEIEIKFTWVGQISYLQRLSIEADLEKTNLNDTVFFVGEQKNPEVYFQKFDVFLMPSREDPFPLVCIEVGKMGVPIICFEKATGTAEILANGGGFVVPYLDCVAMAEKIISYYYDDELRRKDGEMNRQNFADFTPDILAERIYDCIQNLYK